MFMTKDLSAYVTNIAVILGCTKLISKYLFHFGVNLFFFVVLDDAFHSSNIIYYFYGATFKNRLNAIVSID